tara:strand:- start:224 stop:652 length:429 start_codon:yes stop_codon:yes gene_type:complete
MIKNILMENMRRFGTKNLAEGWGDVAKLIKHTQEFKTIFTLGQSEDVINSTIDQMINDWGGPADAAELIQGALESVDGIKKILKPLIAQDSTLDVEMLNKIVDRLPFDEATKQQLQRSIMKLAQDLNVSTPDGNTSTGPRLA